MYFTSASTQAHNYMMSKWQPKEINLWASTDMKLKIFKWDMHDKQTCIPDFPAHHKPVHLPKAMQHFEQDWSLKGGTRFTWLKELTIENQWASSGEKHWLVIGIPTTWKCMYGMSFLSIKDIF
jgi:hypothetical protein